MSSFPATAWPLPRLAPSLMLNNLVMGTKHPDKSLLLWYLPHIFQRLMVYSEAILGIECTGLRPPTKWYASTGGACDQIFQGCSDSISKHSAPL
jgi:hypothetical protein